jgi:hypothetical protein
MRVEVVELFSKFFAVLCLLGEANLQSLVKNNSRIYRMSRMDRML